MHIFHLLVMWMAIGRGLFPQRISWKFMGLYYYYLEVYYLTRGIIRTLTHWQCIKDCKSDIWLASQDDIPFNEVSTFHIIIS